MYSAIFNAFFPTTSMQCHRHQNSRFLHSEFAFPRFWRIIREDLPFRQPRTPETENFGEIEIGMRTRSRQITASWISMPPPLAEPAEDLPVSGLLSLKKAFLRYFGAKTTW